MRALFNDAQWRFVYQLRCEGHKLRDICQWLGVNENTVCYNFQRLGLNQPKRELSEYTSHFLALGGDKNV